MPNHCTVQIQLSERTVIQRWRSGTCCQLIQDQTGSLNPSATLYILKLTKLSSRHQRQMKKCKMEDASVSHFSSTQFEHQHCVMIWEIGYQSLLFKHTRYLSSCLMLGVRIM